MFYAAEQCLMFRSTPHQVLFLVHAKRSTPISMRSLVYKIHISSLSICIISHLITSASGSRRTIICEDSPASILHIEHHPFREHVICDTTLNYDRNSSFCYFICKENTSPVSSLRDVYDRASNESCGRMIENDKKGSFHV